MKRTITALLLALVLLLGLSGCTSKKDNGSSNDTPGNNTTQNGGNTDNYNPDSGMSNDGNTNNGTQNGGTNSDGNNSNNGTTNNPAARNYGTSENDSFMGSRSYEQMLRDGRIHDTDGDLTDGENSVSDW